MDQLIDNHQFDRIGAVLLVNHIHRSHPQKASSRPLPNMISKKKKKKKKLRHPATHCLIPFDFYFFRSQSKPQIHNACKHTIIIYTLSSPQ